VIREESVFTCNGLPLSFIASAQAQGLSNGVLYLACHDVGRLALEGLKGVSKVTSGFKEFKEVNTVIV
jgi:hypothetical protein